jgi:hypothetical protein
VAGDGERAADGFGEPLSEETAETVAFERVFETGLERVDVGGEPAFAPEVVPDVLVGGHDAVGGDAGVFCDGFGEETGFG